eukprot:TRINITY_DN2954_c1_g2_i10.p1 TRINITY_DN2954_c1_g2~~TRINITY_DN2954_c1_g2_i10.p1  ORF type:complete len:255 (+),score=-23.36 TRINITY_DN2954_c1_g2_i10:68-832(+)
MFSLHDLVSGSLFSNGRFRFPLERSLVNFSPTRPWHTKLLYPLERTTDPNSIVCKYKKILNLPSSWDRRIMGSTCRIADGNKFTAQFQISSDIIRFYHPCKDCGFIFNTTVHAFVDCPLLKIVKTFVQLNVGVDGNGLPGQMKAIILFGAHKRSRNSLPHHKAIECALLNIKSLVGKKLTINSPIHEEELRSIMIGAAARYSALGIKIPQVASSSWIWAGDIIKFIPSTSAQYLSLIKSIARRYKRFMSRTALL